MQIIKISPQSEYGKIANQAKRIGYLIMLGGLVIFFTGLAIAYSTLKALGIIGLIPSMIGIIIMLPGFGLIVWGYKMVKVIIKLNNNPKHKT
ncbi:hypothetical protein CO101_02930 [Candidatus Berkelbacteria bacterium CG_4_9_14_3_um_filter_39_23]|uniref:DUF3098 domain-containing protein n=2 Tax=Candidatus Berkelbacteria TaxID=1618330 RepID=A0A2M7CJ36_9BACT|nr:hypothetical protein [Candidatus Berkelbacteria bacterium]OIP05826.1 MAG: hypothetical protein AUK14_00995 [Candidatus Berkelbacteria bacterium CG2_30_39_44]PIR28249.1 MAG: hypothetical protein COV39_00025 [Candidatus Berkelbacteria bacterium CG11_big_fil_rev_8_21_14_0_20_40_23]PIV25639.1 MAG: hypothetical protein COS38_00550 [Candidatus Berkelbacteria bacterium CG03_land_8_20_14_0_80_40_36]PIX30801.1 MAG: hypothetical protein COZ62_00630 [Candidatus Berkelbacteria bacterium CG_4_8_14_3_um_f